jgi:hypothetical protein
MSASFFPQKADTKQSEKNQKTLLSCPVCRGIVKPGYDTQIGRVFVCENYPKNCKYIVRENKEREATI